MDREYLYNFEIEASVLSALMNYNTYIQIADKVNKDDFYNSKHQVIYENIKNSYVKNDNIDVLLLIDELKNNNELDKVGGASYITEVSSSLLSYSNIDIYIAKLKEYSKKRKLVEISKNIISDIDKEADDILSDVTTSLNGIIGKESEENALEQGDSYIKRLVERIESKEEAFIKTGIWTLDDKINGFNKGDLVTIFAFSGTGKTTLATQIAANNIKAKKRVLFFSLEMTEDQIRDRIISSMTSIPGLKLRNAKLLNEEDITNITKANTLLQYNNALNVCRRDNLSDIISKIQYEVLKNDIDVVFIDYINLINIPGYKKEEYNRVSECTRALKSLALTINKPIVILAQGKQEQADKLKNSSLTADEKVSVNDIAGGSSIFRDSDIVLGIYRNVELDNDAVLKQLKKDNTIDYNSSNPDKNPRCAKILVKKSRATGKTTVPCKWKPEYYRIDDWL